MAVSVGDEEVEGDEMNLYWYAHNESECVFTDVHPLPELSETTMHCDAICPCVTGKKEEVIAHSPQYKDFTFHEPQTIP